MGQGFLIDTNILIYFFDGKIPEYSRLTVRSVFSRSFNISAISKIEFPGWQKYSDQQYQKAEQFISGANIFSLTDEIVGETIRIKRQKIIKLPDAVIAATCLANGFTLVSRNEEDFKKIGIKIGLTQLKN